jgi:hypothetical protein
VSLRLPIAATVVCGVLLCASGASAQSNAESPAPSSAPATAVPAKPFATGRPPPPVGELKSLGKDRYQIGRIVVDKKAGRFTVPGRVHVMGQPLEYLVTSPGGMKEYETLLEADATGSEFNLACILLGLERDPKQGPFYQFSEAPLVGPKVLVSIAWQDGGKRREISAAEALLDPKGDVRPESVEWVYTGSLSMPPEGQFAADITGTLIGFVHDANSIIESVLGLGIGAYGSVSGNTALLPPVGTPVEVVVQLSREKAKPAGP